MNKKYRELAAIDWGYKSYHDAKNRCPKEHRFAMMNHAIEMMHKDMLRVCERECNKSYRNAAKIVQKNFKYGEFTVTKEILKNVTDYPEIPFNWQKNI